METNGGKEGVEQESIRSTFVKGIDLTTSGVDEHD